MVNFVDTILDTSQTGGVIKYNLTHADSTTEQVQLAMATPVQTQGTPLNKATFDSIQTDLTNLNNNKLNVSSKATQSEAEAGTNDTKYMTPLKVQQKFDSLFHYYEQQQGSGTIDLTQWTDKVIEITGYAMQISSSSSYIRLNGTGIAGNAGTSSGSATFTLFAGTKGTGYRFPFHVIIDQKTQTIFANIADIDADNYNSTRMANYGTLTSLSYNVGTPQSSSTIGFKAVIRISS